MSRTPANSSHPSGGGCPYGGGVDAQKVGRRGYREVMQAGFDALSDLYYEYWGEFFHLALFEPGSDPADLAAAYERTHERYLGLIGGGRAARILEIACGGGAFAAWMADHTDAEVLGVDVSKGQIARARRRLADGRRPHLRFEQRDIMELDGLGGEFDAVVCLDAACYLPDRGAALRAIARRLRPGGRLLVVDWCRAERTTALQRELLLDPLCRMWAIEELEAARGYRRKLESAGFEAIEIEDLSDRVGPNWERGYRAALSAVTEPLRPGHVVALATSAVRHGPAVVRAAKDQFSVALLAKAAADSGALRYVLACASRR
jgi:2-polyprenyl-3-methyl-5-hydroxy-6-metoxy-1,4-benzoquinol methylase